MGFLQHTAKWGGKKSSLKHLPRQLLPGKHSLNKMLISIRPNSSVLTRKVVSEIQLSTKDDYFYNLNTNFQISNADCPPHSVLSDVHKEKNP